MKNELLARLTVLSKDVEKDPPWRPEIFNLAFHEDGEKLEWLLTSGQVKEICDEFRHQLRELILTRDPREDVDEHSVRSRMDKWLDGKDMRAAGRWVFYPWSGKLVHLLPPEEFHELRTNRNRNKITLEEQARLRDRVIGIAGLSVGRASALTMALEGVGGTFRLADHDPLDLSNLNRLWAGTCDLRWNKAVLAARSMFEINPYLEIEIFKEGIIEANMGPFLGGLHLLVEECDSIDIKVRLREEARARGIDVVMETSDRGLIDVELFGRDPKRPLFHGLVGDLRAERLRGLSTKEKIPLVLGILGAGSISARLAASMPEVRETIWTWPQLASDVALGGAILTNTVRRILLGQLTVSGRFYVDTEQLVCEGKQVEIPPYVPLIPEPLPAAATDRTIAFLAPEHREDAPVTDEEVRWLVHHALLAPSGGNNQPWLFRWNRARLDCHLDPKHVMAVLDFRGLGSYVALGAAIHNIEVAARARHLRTLIDINEKDRFLVCSLRFERGDVTPDHGLVAAIRARVTNRKAPDKRMPLQERDINALEEAATRLGGRLRLITDPEALKEAGEVLGEGDRLLFTTKVLHAGLMSELRWTREEELMTRDGIGLRSLELSGLQAAGAHLLKRGAVSGLVAKWGGGHVLAKDTAKTVFASGAVGFLTTDGLTADAYFKGGRALESVWLEATRRGIALHPFGGLPYLFARVERGGGEGLDAKTCDELRRLAVRLRGVFGTRGPSVDGQGEILVFRLFYPAEPPSAISLRRPIEAMLTID